MDILYVINYAIFSVFLTMFMIEIGFALVTLVNYNRYKSRINPLINPIWEVTGTFAIFYVLNFEVSYPTLVSVVGTAYAVPLLIAAIFIILRNVFLVLSGYIAEQRSERLFRLVYSISTLSAAVLVIAVLTSGVSGAGISPSTSSLNSTFIINPFTILMLIALLLLSLALANSLVKFDRFFKFGIAIELIGFMFAYLAIIVYLPGFNVLSHVAAFSVSMVLFGASLILQYVESKHSGIFDIIFLILLINLFGLSVYPYIFGTTNITNYIATSALAGPEILITAIGGTIVALSLAVLIYFNYVKK